MATSGPRPPARSSTPPAASVPKTRPPRPAIQAPTPPRRAASLPGVAPKSAQLPAGATGEPSTSATPPPVLKNRRLRKESLAGSLKQYTIDRVPVYAPYPRPAEKQARRHAVDG